MTPVPARLAPGPAAPGAASFDPQRRSHGGRAKRRALPERRSRRPQRWVPDAALVLAGLGLGATVGSVLTNETRSQLSAPGGVATFLGSATGLIGTYLALMMVLLASRIPAVERTLGQDGLLRWHRRLAPWPISLIALHAVFITVGYADAAKTGIGHEISTLMRAYPDVLIATVALALMLIVGAISIPGVRQRLRRERWWSVHLTLYVALALSFPHVIVLGPSFVGHPLAQILWSVAWAATAGVVLVFRVGIPVLRSIRHRLKVVEVHPEADGVVSVICKGRRLDRLAVSGGQFFEWRFLVRGMWWQAHPYSLSALPRPPYLRLTVKAVGDHSSSLAHLRPGTRVAIEGPYGSFTAHAMRRSKVALVAGGIGVTATRALLEDLPRQTQPVVVVRASRQEDIALGAELTELVRQRRGQFHELVGPRHQIDFGSSSLLKLIPDLARRDVFVCGPEDFVTETVQTMRGMGIAEDALHFEAYAL